MELQHQPRAWAQLERGTYSNVHMLASTTTGRRDDTGDADLTQALNLMHACWGRGQQQTAARTGCTGSRQEGTPK